MSSCNSETEHDIVLTVLKGLFPYREYSHMNNIHIISESLSFNHRKENYILKNIFIVFKYANPIPYLSHSSAIYEEYSMAN